MRKNVFCVFEGTRKSTRKKKAAGWREEEGAIFLKKQGKKEHQKLTKNRASHSLTHQLLFPPRGGALHYSSISNERRHT
jgi:hypothetical protein